MSDDPNSSETSQDANSPAAPRRRRSFLPRFGLRTALLFAVVFCLLMGWVGRNFVRIREEDAAIETLKQAGAVILLQGNDFRARHPATPEAPPGGPPRAAPLVVPSEDWYGRLFGWAERLPIRHVNLQGHDPKDEKLDAALEALAVFPEIESVNLLGTGVDDAALPPLTKMAGLESIGLFDTSLTAEGLKALVPARELRRLNLSGQSTGIAAGLSPLKQLRVLSIIRIGQGGPADDTVEMIASLPHLEELTLMYLQPESPEFFTPLSSAKKLRALTTLGIPLAPEDVLSIAALPKLESLRIDGIDDAALAKLAPLPTLKKIELGPPVTSQAAFKFSQSHPDCRVEYALYRPDGIIFQAGETVEPSADPQAR